MSAQQHILVQKLDEFIRKYYKNQLLKGAIYSGAILTAAFLSVVLLEYFGEFNTSIRAVLFFGFVFSALGVLVNYITVPLLKLNKIGSIISYDQAANIIGNHFSTVQDKLLNVLQLQHNKAWQGSEDLLLASINQKINELKPVAFASAIDLNENKKHLKYLLPLLFLMLGIFIFSPQIISKGTKRLVNYQTFYEKEMPFTFSIQNQSLRALQTQDFNLQVKVTGSELPNEVFISINNMEYKLEKENKNAFHFTFSNPQATTKFQLGAAGFLSKEYVLEVLPKPSLLQFNLQLVYPAYLNKASETLENTGDMQIPQGTKVNWTFRTKNTDNLNLHFADSNAVPEKNNENEFRFSRRFLQSNHYTIKALNQFVQNAADSVNYSINVVSDQYPSIEVAEKQDSLNSKNIYFSGQIKDDYGFSNLTFHYKKFGIDSLGKARETKGNFPVAFSKTQISQPYFYFLDAAQFDLQPGDKIEYYFEVFDNDGVNGAKSSKTQVMSYKAPTRDEINEATEKNNSQIKKDLEESIKKSKQLQKDINEMSKKINDKNQLGYEEKKKLEDLLKKQKELENKIEQLKQENEQNNKQQNEFSQTDESILEKQQQLEQLFENVMTPEMKKLFDELNKMLEQLDKNQVQEKLEELKLTNKDIEKELDRNLEAFKQLEIEQKMQNAIDKLDELQKKQDDLNKETDSSKQKAEEKKNAEDNKQDKDGSKQNDKQETGNKQEAKNNEQKAMSNDELQKKQDNISKEFEELKKDLDELQQKNSELEEPNQLPNTDEKENEISKEMQNASQQLSKNNKNNASKSQQNASKKMQEMKEQMEQAMQDAEEEQQEENMAALRQILENLVNLSYAQEDLITTLPKTRIDNPQYVDIPKQQNKLKDDSKIIEDSLLALSKRAPQISALVNREISAIHLNMNKTVSALAERNVGESTTRMQTTMTSVNNLALLLNEILQQMQNQAKSQKESKGDESNGKNKCKKPGSGKNPSSQGKKGNSAESMRKMQEQLNKQLQELKNALEKGQKEGGQKPGDKQGQGQQGKNGKTGSSMLPGSSEQFAKMAAQQEALRRQMQEMMSKLKNQGKNAGGDLANLMEQTERDLVNKQLTNETMKRQQEILTRLLESEKAERERDEDEQRKSNEAKNQNLSNPKEFLEYKRLKEKEMELLNTVPPDLTPYYKEKVNNYFNSLNK
ncbi:MAG: hypothetical protein KF900_00055 [Bacteroidetes bacterium]|nr:hypothetical protein [Bacteroidota bacterium]